MGVTTDDDDHLTDTIPPVDYVPLTARLKPEIHAAMKEYAERSGRSLNSLLNEACADALTIPGGSAQINNERRKLTPAGDRAEQAWAALAHILAYLNLGPDAKRAWPWSDEVPPGDSDIYNLAMAGGLLAAEIDLFQGGQRH